MQFNVGLIKNQRIANDCKAKNKILQHLTTYMMNGADVYVQVNNYCAVQSKERCLHFQQNYGTQSTCQNQDFMSAQTSSIIHYH